MREIKFRQPVFSVDGEFKCFAYWGYIYGAFKQPGQYCIENEDCGCDSYRPAEPTKGEPSMVEENPMITRTLENIEALPKNGAIFVDAGGRAQIATAITTFTLQALAVAYRQQATDLAAALERVKELEK